MPLYSVIMQCYSCRQQEMLVFEEPPEEDGCQWCGGMRTAVRVKVTHTESPLMTRLMRLRAARRDD